MSLLLVTPAAVLGQLPDTVAPRTISFEEARPIIAALKEKLPTALADRGGDDLANAWRGWLMDHRKSTAERLDRGDVDSVVNLWLYGTSFTQRPPARLTGRHVENGVSVAELAEQRLNDFLSALVAPPDNERLLFARDVVERQGLDLTTRAGLDAARDFLRRARDRAQREFEQTDQVISSSRTGTVSVQLEVHSTIFRNRGLSSDTSLLVDFALERALATLGDARVLTPGSIRRIAIVGPGLDFINKADGHDFYAQQSIQPFALLDTLLRLGLADANAITVTTLDVSARVNGHLATARARSRAGNSYLLTLPLSRDERWEADLKSYWQQFGAAIGEPKSAAALDSFSDADVRTIAIRPAIVDRIVPLSFDVVVDRLDLPPDERFDVVIATNVFVYYDAFAQALAGANVAAMLRPGGILLSNNDLFVTAPMSSTVGHLAVTYSDRQNDNVFVYQRQ